MDILDQMEAWRKNARFISEQDFFSRMIFEIITNRNEIERLREALDDMIQFVRKEYGSNDVRVQAAEAVLKGKE